MLNFQKVSDLFTWLGKGVAYHNVAIFLENMNEDFISEEKNEGYSAAINEISNYIDREFEKCNREIEKYDEATD